MTPIILIIAVVAAITIASALYWRKKAARRRMLKQLTAERETKVRQACREVALRIALPEAAPAQAQLRMAEERLQLWSRARQSDQYLRALEAVNAARNSLENVIAPNYYVRITFTNVSALYDTVIGECRRYPNKTEQLFYSMDDYVEEMVQMICTAHRRNNRSIQEPIVGSHDGKGGPGWTTPQSLALPVGDPAKTPTTSSMDTTDRRELMRTSKLPSISKAELAEWTKAAEDGRLDHWVKHLQI